MNSRQAKEALLLYRPGTADNADPEIAQALEVARHDPELGRWREQHCALQSAVRAHLRQIPVPEGLREQIISEINAEIRSNRRTRLSLITGALVALALALGLLVFLAPSHADETLAALRNRLERYALLPYNMDRATNDLPEIRRYLASQGAPSDYILPPTLNSLETLGCAKRSWQGEPVTMLCFAENKTNRMWLFVIDRAALRSPPSAVPTFEKVNRLMTASWSQGGRIYVLAGEQDEADLRRYF